MGDKNEKIRNPKLAVTALIIKGALNSLYKTPLTVGNKYETKFKGRVIVEYSGATPDESDLYKLQKIVDQVVENDLAVSLNVMNRADAEIYYYQNPVAGQFIYEKTRPPDCIETLNIVAIENWTVCCTNSTDFLESTKLVGNVELLRFNHRENKRELEVCFRISEDSDLIKNDCRIKANGNSSKIPLNFINVDDISSQLIDIFMESLKNTDPSVLLTPAQIDAVKTRTKIRAIVVLNSLKNLAYAQGFSSKK